MFLPTLPVDVLLIGHVKLGYAKQGQRDPALPGLPNGCSSEHLDSPIGHCRTNKTATNIPSLSTRAFLLAISSRYMITIHLA